ncbi:ribonuclease HIII [Staphylococcus sp. mip270_02]|uniref:Ribonuclease HIII n=2 Tax=Staphylococcus xylosus TaxID=1288 RepID=A0A418IQZ0_STAXY|nr:MULTISPECIES: ribonuclease HIII [Staphylococcus]MBF0813249.1 ribonuclease HIII [Staphylococcus saprophyticus]MDW8544372.1 ribonuclease HIII [Staphylococcus sp. KG4-1]MRF38518.1 ribonuclease HIII [Staphylococcus sp. KY49P]MDW8560870.1 ribonuclease HIII [Staphylococcus sp. KG4-3]PTI10188.1 ribonuclease HIII [Staphylococcus xylosus]
MSNVVHKLTKQQIDQLMSKISFDTTNVSQGMKAKTKYKNTSISVYNSNKVMFQGKDAESIASQLLPNVVPAKKNTAKSSNSQQAIQYNRYNCIGSDEAGSGDYFGPLTVCAAYVSKKNVQILKALGVDDSKRLTDAKIIELAEQLVTFIPHSLLTMNNDKYNEKQQVGWSQVKMKAVLHNEAIKNVTQKIDTEELDYIVIDQFAEAGVYKRYALSELPFNSKTKFETKGESKSIAIAAASIISRYAFVKHMDNLSRSVKMEIPKGASNKVDLTAAKLIERRGIAYLDSISKKHFANRQKAENLVQKKHK